MLGLSPPGGMLQPAMLNLVARQARLGGFIPVSVDLMVDAERHPTSLTSRLRAIVETRHLLLVTRLPISCTGRGWCARRAARITACPVAAARLLLDSVKKAARTSAEANMEWTERELRIRIISASAPLM